MDPIVLVCTSQGQMVGDSILMEDIGSIRVCICMSKFVERTISMELAYLQHTKAADTTAPESLGH